MGLPSEVYSSVVMFTGEAAKPGTAFMALINGNRVLVTARHLCGEDRDENVVLRHPYTNDGQPVTEMLTRVGRLDFPGDLAVFALPEGLINEPTAATTPPSTSFVTPHPAGMTHGHDCYVLGFPYKLGYNVGLPGAETSQLLPLVKKGVVSGHAVNGQGVSVLYLDIIANPGFSGGPVAVHISPGIVGWSDWRFVGVVSTNVTAPIVEATPEEPEPPRITAGLSLAIGINHAVELCHFGGTDN